MTRALRRLLVVTAALGLVAAPISGAAALSPHAGAQQYPHDPRLTARPSGTEAGCRPGTHLLKLGPGRTAVMHVARGMPSGPRPLLLALHGAGGRSRDGLWIFRTGWSRPGLVLVAPQSEGNSWNPFLGSDLNSVDRALKQAFRRCRIDRRRVGVGGFSDGATTALTLGLSNGDLFRRVLAIAPGGVIAPEPVGKPRVYIAHGTRDRIIPFAKGRTVARELRRFDYRVTFRAFAGDHEVPDAISREAVRWFLGR
jgi:phospholipase/carboxylesterase